MHGHSHGHGHQDDPIGGWSSSVRRRTLQAILFCVVAAGVATVVGLFLLWPTDDGRDEALQNAGQVGLASERLSATVDAVDDGPCSYSTAENPQDCRVLTFELNEGPNDGSLVTLPEINLTFNQAVPEVSVGDKVIVGYEPSTDFYFYADRDRRQSMVALAVLFALVVVALGRLRGLLALGAMALTVVVLIWFVAPSVLDGNDPVLVAVVAASVIAFLSLYLTHGFSPTTTVALAGTLASLGLTWLLSWLFFGLANFTGLATEEALLLPLIAPDLDVAALLLGGAIIGSLGALDDVTVTQAATVAELRLRSPSLSRAQLMVSGIRVGREHIAATVNTLLLAYAGASLPLLLLFAVSEQPLDMVANAELISVEIIRTLCGSIGLVAAVPLTTALAAVAVSPPTQDGPPKTVTTDAE